MLLWGTMSLPKNVSQSIVCYWKYMSSKTVTPWKKWAKYGLDPQSTIETWHLQLIIPFAMNASNYDMLVSRQSNRYRNIPIAMATFYYILAKNKLRK